MAPDFLTFSDALRELRKERPSLRRHQLRYALIEAEIEPVGRIGPACIFSRNQLGQLRSAIARTSARRQDAIH